MSSVSFYPTSEPARVWRIGPRKSLIIDRVLIMGILNATPDSFSDGGRYDTAAAAAVQAARLAERGADIIDIGCQSTRPGFTRIPAGEELSRLGEVRGAITDALPEGFPLSIDTFYPEVARYALRHGVSIVNDVSGLADPAMRGLVAEYGCGAVLMHSDNIEKSGDPAGDVRTFFEERAAQCADGGIDAEQLVLDCGIGFGKTRAQELFLLRHIGECRALDRPLLAAASRKRVIKEYYLRDGVTLDEATLAAHREAAASGAQLVRVHEPGGAI